MSAPRTYFHPGRASQAKPRPIEVESQPCPATLNAECHELHNTRAGVTRCRWCGVGWGALDAELRAGVAV